MAEQDPESINEDFAPRRGAAVYAVEVDGEAVLLDESANRLHHLNHTAALLWACFDGHVRSSELAADIAEELQLPYEQVLNDALVVIRNLGSEGLLDGVRPTLPKESDEP